MYKFLLAAFVLFPHVASAHGAHAPVDTSMFHSVLHSAGGMFVIGVVAIATAVVFRKAANRKTEDCTRLRRG